MCFDWHYGTRTDGGRYAPSALERFDFDSVLLPFKAYVLSKNERYLTELGALAERCVNNGMWRCKPSSPLCIPRGASVRPVGPPGIVRWKTKLPSTEPSIGSWDMMQFSLNSVGDIHVLPRVLDAADRFEASPTDEEMQRLRKLGAGDGAVVHLILRWVPATPISQYTGPACASPSGRPAPTQGSRRSAAGRSPPWSILDGLPRLPQETATVRELGREQVSGACSVHGGFSPHWKWRTEHLHPMVKPQLWILCGHGLCPRVASKRTLPSSQPAKRVIYDLSDLLPDIGPDAAPISAPGVNSQGEARIAGRQLRRRNRPPRRKNHSSCSKWTCCGGPPLASIVCSMTKSCPLVSAETTL